VQTNSNTRCARADRTALNAIQKWCEDYGHVINAIHSQCDAVAKTQQEKREKKENKPLFSPFLPFLL
jgi:hypothetical protein